MSIIPDYAKQASELMRQLEAQADLTAQYWSDGKRKEFYTQYIEQYLQWIEKYVYGGDDMQGKGLNDLLQFVAEKTDEFERVANVSITGSIIAPGFSTGERTLQILAPADLKGAELSDDVPSEQTPEQITRLRQDWEADRALNSPGNFSSKNLRDILNKRKNG